MDAPNAIPCHIGILMDGNGRWAQKRGLPRIAGHRAAVRNIFPVLDGCAERGVEAVTLCAFRQKTGGRPDEEVAAFLDLVTHKIPWFAEEIRRRGFRMRHSGAESKLSCAVLGQIRHGVDLSSDNTGMIVNVAFNYGGRDEIVRAAREVVSRGFSLEQIDEAQFQRFLDTAGLPDIDLVIRISGEQCLSNFCLWQSASAVFHSMPVVWHDFRVEDFKKALDAYAVAMSR